MKKLIKRFLPRSLLARSMLILVVPVLLIQIFTTFIFFDRAWGHIMRRMSDAVAAEIELLADARMGGVSPDDWTNLRHIAHHDLDMRVEILPLHALGPDSGDLVLSEQLRHSLDDNLDWPSQITVDIDHKKVFIDIALKTEIMEVAISQERLFTSAAYIFLLWVVGMSLVLLAVAVLFMRNQIRPIRRLAVVADRLGRGQDIPTSFKPEGAREVRQAAQAFIDMHRRLSRQVQQRMTMLSGISHDLRTPLTRMTLQTAMLPPGPDADALREDIAEMRRMTDAYLDFARGEGSEATTRADLREIIERVAAAARRQESAVALDLSGDLSMQIRPVAFERVMSNIVGNACKYAPHAWVSASRDETHITIMVDDDGPGVPEDQYEEVFRPFVRGEPSRNPATGGVGLGLPIAQDIIHAHGGRIWLERSEKGGLRVVIRVPA